MKKNIQKIAVVGVLAFTLIGSAIFISTNEIYATNLTQEQLQEKLESLAGISEKEAEEIALSKVKNGTVTHTKLDNWFFKIIYRVYVVSGETINEVVINGRTGEVITVKTEALENYFIQDGQNIDTENSEAGQVNITESEAEKIALDEINGTVMYTNYDNQNGKNMYVVNILTDNSITIVKVDGSTGNIVGTNNNYDAYKKYMANLGNTNDTSTPTPTPKPTDTNTGTENNNSHDNSHNNNSVVTPTENNIITKEEAEKIALKSVDGTVLYTEYDDYHNKYYNTPKYEVYILTNNSVAEIKINANTGAIMEVDHDYDDYHEYQINSGNLTQITKEEAEKIALNRVPGSIVYTESDTDDGMIEYKVNLIYNGMEVEVEIDGLGNITDVEYDD